MCLASVLFRRVEHAKAGGGGYGRPENHAPMRKGGKKR
jgi:stalled ribosome alternative rescue factor ArfA